MKARLVGKMSVAGLTIGKRYDIARVLEAPDLVMIRREDGSWPIPGDERFGWHPGMFFDLPKKKSPETRSCGHRYRSFDFYGLIFSAAELKAKPAVARKLRTLSKRTDLDCGVDFYAEGIVLPRALAGGFALLGFELRSMIRFPSLKAANTYLSSVLSPALLQSRPQYHFVEFWQKYELEF